MLKFRVLVTQGNILTNFVRNFGFKVKIWLSNDKNCVFKVKIVESQSILNANNS